VRLSSVVSLNTQPRLTDRPLPLNIVCEALKRIVIISLRRKLGKFNKQKSHATREFHSKQKREKPPSTMKQQTRTLCAGCRACLIPASYQESISSVQFSSVQFVVGIYLGPGG
jgi:hypothetical protein